MEKVEEVKINGNGIKKISDKPEEVKSNGNTNGNGIKKILM